MKQFGFYTIKTEFFDKMKDTVAGRHLILTSERELREITRKSRKVMAMLKRGVKFTPTQVNISAILTKLDEK
jgi:hypothetical protein